MSLPGGTPFIVFGDDWNRYPSTIQHIFRHIALDYPVIWINGIGHRVPSFSRRDLKRAWEKLTKVGGEVAPPSSGDAKLGEGQPAVIIEPRVLPWHHVGWVHALNTRYLLKAIRRALATLNSPHPPVLVTGSPPSVGVVGELGESVSVYYCLADFLNFPTYTARMLAPLERRLLDRVDMLVATAADLTRTKSPRSGRAHHLPQGVNHEHFSEPRPEPADMADIPHPRIGFAGSLSTQCDWLLLSRLADEFPHASLVLVGPIGIDEETLDRMRQRPNVHILGTRPYEILPAYVQHFDVGIIPYVLSAWTVAVDPLKLLEYLAAGLPVVTTEIPEVAKYRDTVMVAADADAFVQGVRAALAADREAERENGQRLARQHTWQRRAETFVDLVAQVAAEQGR